MKLYEYKIRREFLREEPTTRFMNPQDAFRYLMQNCYQDEEMYRENCYVLFLNNKRSIIGHTLLSTGGIDSTVIDVKIVVKMALDCLATAVIISHNHPSGEATPGKSDILMTSKLKKALDVFDISLLDHIVVGESSYYSFSDEQIHKAE